MRKFTTEHTVYDFDELSDDAKQKAIENLYDINVDYDWWDGDLEWFNSDFFNPIGLHVEQMYFDLDRGAYIAFDNVEVTDEKKLLKASGYDLRRSEARHAVEYGIRIEFETNTNLNAGAVRAISLYDDDILNDVEDKIYEVAQECLSKLQGEYDYYTSEEAIIETIKANEYEFYEDGRLA